MLTTIHYNRDALAGITAFGALMGLYILIRHWSLVFNELRNNRYLYVSLAFLIPIGIAMIDTLYPIRRYAVFLTMLIYLLIGILPVWRVATGSDFKRLELLTFCAVMFICADAVMQWQFGYHSLGYNPVEGSRVMGIFGIFAHLSYVLGTFAPIVFFFIYQKLAEKFTIWRLIGGLIALMLLTTGVLIGGARAGLVSLFVTIILFIAYLFYKNKIKYKLRFIGTVLLLFIISLAILSQTEIVQQRFVETTSAFGSDDFWAQFTSVRTHIWYVVINEFPNYWINGVGTRGFDTLYQTYPEDFKIHPLVAHPHLHGLEVLIETGIIGFIPYLLVCLYLFIRMFTAKAGNMWIMMGFVSLMPINTHTGLYQSFWFPMVWVPIMVGLAIAYRADKS